MLAGPPPGGLDAAGGDIPAWGPTILQLTWLGPWWTGGPLSLSCGTGDGMDEVKPKGSSSMESSARLPVTLGQTYVSGDMALPEPPCHEGAEELLLQQGPLWASHLGGVVMWPCCWTLSCPGLSLGKQRTLGKARGTTTPCTKSVPKQDLLLLTLVLL